MITYPMNRENLIKYLKKVYPEQKFRPDTHFKVEETGAIYEVTYAKSGRVVAIFGQGAFQTVLNELDSKK